LYLSRLIIDAESSQDYLEQEDMLKLVIDCMTAMMTDDLEKSIRDLRGKIKDAEKAQKDTESLIKELSELQKKRHSIREKLRELKV
jgi:predicted nuclease with TOPRIM domain